MTDDTESARVELLGTDDAIEEFTKLAGTQVVVKLKNTNIPI